MLPPELVNWLLSEEEPGEVYRRCVRVGARLNYADTEAMVYAVEVRYALEVLEGRVPRLYNFGDLTGEGDRALFRALSLCQGRRVAFIGSGPYPVTALLLHAKHPDLEITCFENNLVGFLLGRAVLRRLAPSVEPRFADGHELDLRGYDLIVLAAMVGDRSALARKLLDTTGAQLVVRGELDWTHPRLHSVASAFQADGSLA